MADASSDRPQCYNCGQHGHWAVACPEPTRQTPAGLVAWRNAAGTSQNPGQDNNSAGKKKNQGPIITRYGPPPPPLQSAQPPPPPPPPLPQPQQPFYHPHSGYPPLPPPPPPQHYPAYTSYPQHPQYSSNPYSSHQPSNASYQAQYPPPQNHPSDYSARQGPPSHNVPSYGSYHPHYPSPVQPLPPPQHQHSASAHRGRPPAPYHASHQTHPQLEPPHPNSSKRQGDSQRHQFNSRKHQSHSEHTSNNRSKKQGGNAGFSGSSKRPLSSPPSQLPLPTGILSLPPKPPASVMPHTDHADRDREQWKRQKPDRNNLSKEDKQKGSQRGKKETSKHQNQPSPQKKPAEPKHPLPDPKKQSANSKRRDRKKKKRLAKIKSEEEQTQAQERTDVASETANAEAPVERAKTPEPDNVLEVDQPGKCETSKESGTGEKADESEDPNRRPQSPQTDAVENLPSDEDNYWEWQENTIFKEIAEPPHGPDETGKPLPIIYNDGIVFPRKWDATCIESEFVKPDNLKEFVRPICETGYWDVLRFDPAFIVEGQFSDGTSLETARSITLALKQSEDGAKERTLMSTKAQEDLQGKQSNPQDSVEERSEKTHGKRSPPGGSLISPQGESSAKTSLHTPNSVGKRPRDSSDDRQYRHGRIDRWEPSNGQDRGRARENSHPRRRSIAPEQSTRESSIASDQSSDLSSIEAELLGRPSKKAKKEKRKQTRLPSTSRGGRRGHQMQHRSRSNDRGRSHETPAGRRW